MSRSQTQEQTQRLGEAEVQIRTVLESLGDDHPQRARLSFVLSELREIGEAL